MNAAEELRAAATKLRERGSAAREVTMTGRGDEWDGWTVVQNMRVDETKPPVEVNDEIFGPMETPVYEPTGTATVIHAVYAHDTEEDWYEGAAVASDALPPVAEWIALMCPAVAEPLARWLELYAAGCEVEATDLPGTVQALAVARAINGGGE